MSLNDLLQEVQYVTDYQGARRAVLLDLDIWQALLHHLDIADESGDKDEKQKAMSREEAAYQAMYEDLYTQYAGQYVAIYQGELVDHDEDGSQLYQRIRQQYPGQFVLITPVESTAEEKYQILSPRLIIEEISDV